MRKVIFYSSLNFMSPSYLEQVELADTYVGRGKAFASYTEKIVDVYPSTAFYNFHASPMREQLILKANKGDAVIIASLTVFGYPCTALRIYAELEAQGVYVIVADWKFSGPSYNPEAEQVLQRLIRGPGDLAKKDHFLLKWKESRREKIPYPDSSAKVAKFLNIDFIHGVQGYYRDILPKCGSEAEALKQCIEILPELFHAKKNHIKVALNKIATLDSAPLMESSDEDSDDEPTPPPIPESLRNFVLDVWEEPQKVKKDTKNDAKR